MPRKTLVNLFLLFAIFISPLSLAASPEPEVIIREEKNQTIEEYRINGQLYAIKVIPKKGKPYYLVDSDGNGELDLRQERGKLVVPKWLLFSW